MDQQMSLRDQQPEIRRLISALEAEAEKYHAIQLSTLFVTQDAISSEQKFSHPNHAVMLWQYYYKG